MHILARHVKVSFLGRFPNPAQPHIPSHPSQLLPGLVGRAMQALCVDMGSSPHLSQDFFTFPIFFLPLSYPTLLSSHAFYSISDFLIRLWGLGHPWLGHGVGWHFFKNVYVRTCTITIGTLLLWRSYKSIVVFTLLGLYALLVVCSILAAAEHTVSVMHAYTFECSNDWTSERIFNYSYDIRLYYFIILLTISYWLVL